MHLGYGYVTNDPVFVVIIVTGLIAILFGTAVGLSLTHLIARRRKWSLFSDRGLLLLDERLTRMEQAIDVIAVEMERVSEGQRFTTKLLSERPREPVG